MKDAYGEYTLCWRCSKSMPVVNLTCPHCHAINANIDLKGAYEQMMREFNDREQPNEPA